jgi:N-dimethylarginine dimethylaminohydrolase
MLPILIKNEFSRLRSVLFGTSQSIGPIPLAEDCYDPTSLHHILSGTYPAEVDMNNEMSAVLEIFKKYEIQVFRPSVIKNYNQIFARDIAFVVENKLIISNILPERDKEINALESLFKLISKENRFILPEDCHVEGGDVIVSGNYIFIGVYSGHDYSNYITARTNLKIVKTFELRKSNTNPLENALHLDCCFQPLGLGKALIHSNSFLNQVDYKWLIDFFGRENVFDATNEEMSQMNCNIFSISETVVISEQNFSRLNLWLVSQGFTVEKVPYSEISKQGGLLRCSTLPLIRD